LLLNYGYIALLLIVAILFAASLPLLSFTLARLGVVPHKPTPVKTSTYECGMETLGKTWVQFNFRYYFYAFLFVAFDILTVFLYPWAANLRELRLFGFGAIVVFLVIILVGYLYAWRKRALEWT
jgi:NADH-quinone oxidoreductase subunit A